MENNGQWRGKEEIDKIKTKQQNNMSVSVHRFDG
jgi:hypothetical protein